MVPADVEGQVMIVVGIDPGVHTGFAVVRDGKLIEMASPALNALEAMRQVEDLANGARPNPILVVFEDARLIGGMHGAARGSKEANARAQGAGSIKRDCQLWADHLGALGVAYMAVSPKEKGAKLDADRFRQVTGWTLPTNEHSRDAAVLAWRFRNQRSADGGMVRVIVTGENQAAR
jgi:hypothetical protein